MNKPVLTVGPYQCVICDFKSPDWDEVLNHLKTHEREGYTIGPAGPVGATAVTVRYKVDGRRPIDDV